MGSSEFDCDAELYKDCGYPLDPNKRCQSEIDAERKAALYHRIEELEENAERHGDWLANVSQRVDTMTLHVKRLITRIEALERRCEDDGK